MIKKRRWLTFFLAMLPGVGHMYLGFKKLGVQYMLGASLCIIFIPAEPMIFPFVLAALWFYQLFDALQKVAWMKLTAAEHERMMFHPDGFGAPWMMDMHAAPGYPHDEVNPAWIGFGCVAAGILMLLITVFPAVWSFLNQIEIGTILLSLGLIGYGLKMLKSNPRV
ncbi:hypothetical protein GCM10010912_28660 [Paenibacillus albidus]|uniref:TM2 domain-containing protein n=1 Tax=Paenibacillus albidus TaxID=2041023 RepID=A0A917CCG6_9BACL|nr:hypothetical protein [Paenibacillus albidus]MBT2289783.1 hypothetical protein [Paenibacillus albidus]GGF81831.1 hypothetical protein GCM10010912_28660 [Paenibacillus albidus]